LLFVFALFFLSGSPIRTSVVNRYVCASKHFSTMTTHARHLLHCLAAAALLLSHSFCKQKNTFETVETRDAEGRLERYQRRASDSAKEGLYQKFRPDNTLLEESHYRNDTLEGERKFFYPNGKVESVEHYQYGVIEGKFQKFYESGALSVEQTYANGALNGQSVAFYPNGVVRERVTLRDNEENGPFTEYHENGKVKAEGSYAPGSDGPLENGELKEYDENGALIRIADCTNGTCTTRWKK
jgi:antitoxin component YwqK of YwqJK toxin-antitoxin module